MKRRTQKKIQLATGVLIGLFFIATSYLSYLDISGNDIQNPMEAHGVIKKIYTNVVTSHVFYNEEQEKFAPTVEFTTSDGKKVEFIDFGQSEDRTSFQIGQAVTVIYDSLKPQSAVIKTENPFWGIPSVVLGIGLFVILLTSVIYRL